MAVAIDYSMEDLFGEVISSYTRAEAIEDGCLVDVTEWASSTTGFYGGFTVPVAVTASVWHDINAIPASKHWQDVRGRAHDVLCMCAFSARSPRNQGASEFLYSVIMDIAGTRKRTQVYKAVIGPGDNGEPVITIMQPNED
jgi:hypothetical protein